MTKFEKIPTLQTAIKELCGKQKIQSGKHIKPLTQYCATRLVLEGGFPPEWISPRPPFASTKKSNAIYDLKYAPGEANESEARVLGGIKYKDVDITVVVPGVGPALAISVKNTGNAFRNLTNRMEEALGECTNVHLMYPGFVFGFLHFLRFRTINEAGTPDASFTEKGEPLPAITRYHEVMNSLSGRRLITDPSCATRQWVSLSTPATSMQESGGISRLQRARFTSPNFSMSCTSCTTSGTPILILMGPTSEKSGNSRWT